MNSKSRNLLRSSVCVFAFPAPCVEEEKQDGKIEHKLSDAWTYEYLSVNASRWTFRPWITQTKCPGRVPYLLGDLYDHEIISQQDGFGEMDPFVFGLTPLRWSMIAVIICVRTRFVSSDNIPAWICFQLWLPCQLCTDACSVLLHYIHTERTLQGSVCVFLVRNAQQRRARTISPWPWRVRITSADEPNVTCWVSGITRWTGSSIITSLMGLECSQSFMTAGFLAPDLRAEMRRL